jgi:hypothetical protein
MQIGAEQNTNEPNAQVIIINQSISGQISPDCGYRALRVLVACERSQEICKAFRSLGHEAFSCDIQESVGGHPEWHLHGSVFDFLNLGWDLMIGHPPCTFLSYAGIRHWNAPGRLECRLAALDFFAKLWNAPIEHICLENPKGCASPTIAKYSQEIQPYYFGDPFMKTTWLWLKNLPQLVWTKNTDLFSVATSTGKPEPIYVDASGKGRHFTDALSGSMKETSNLRSKTFPGIAMAIAQQYSATVLAKF